MSQYRVTLPFEPDFTNNEYSLWILPPKEVIVASKALKSVKVVTNGSDSRLSTIMSHNKAALAISKYLSLDERRKVKCLYHGVGKDGIGVRMLTGYGRMVQSYNPHRHGPKTNIAPARFFDEVFSIYVLNTVDERMGEQMLLSIEKRLRNNEATAIIAVRHDM